MYFDYGDHNLGSLALYGKYPMGWKDLKHNVGNITNYLWKLRGNCLKSLSLSFSYYKMGVISPVILISKYLYWTVWTRLCYGTLTKIIK